MRALSSPCLFQKNPRVRKIRVRNSGAGNGCVNFMDAWRKCALLEKPMSIKFLVLGGGILGLGGGECRFYFYGREDFSDFFKPTTNRSPELPELPDQRRLGAKKSTQCFFVQNVSKTLRVMDVRAENRGRPHQKNAFFRGAGGGEKLFDPGSSGRKGQECPREIQTKKFMFMLFFLP